MESEGDGDANARVLRVRALLKRGGKTPQYNTIVRTENVVATSLELQRLTSAVEPAHHAIADQVDNADLKRAIYAVAAVRKEIGGSYGLAQECRAVPDDGAPSKSDGWPPTYATSACTQLSVHAARLVTLCHSFATTHRLQPNAENDVGHAIDDAVGHLQEAYAQCDDEVFKHGEHDEQMEVAARLLNRRARQVATRAKLDAHGEVFTSIEFAATCASLTRAAAVFNLFYVGHSLYSGVSVDEALPSFDANSVAAESHVVLAETLKQAGLKESSVTNTLARASRHAETADAILDVEDPKDPLADIGVHTHAGQPLELSEWASEALRTGVAQFDVIGGFSMSLQGDLKMHDGSFADADWLCLRARTTAPLSGDLDSAQVSHSLATAAWRRMRYDAGTYDAPSFCPSEPQLRAASRIGIALAGRGNLSSDDACKDADLLVVDTGIANEKLGMVVVGSHVPARATLHSAEAAIGYMFSQVELNEAGDSVALDRPSQGHAFLSEAATADPAAWIAEEPREELLPVEVVKTVVSSPLESVPEVLISAHEAFEQAIHTTANVRSLPLDESDLDADADAASRALKAALCITLRESSHAFDALASRVAQHSPASIQLFQMLNHQGERAVDVAASMLGIKELEPVVAELEFMDECLHDSSEQHEEVALDAAFEDAIVESGSDAVGSGTPSSEDLEELE
tara:strand:+ start:12690 stop:14756 length:2067 start_codon:yes stop_codon:yes gene_type:complete